MTKVRPLFRLCEPLILLGSGGVGISTAKAVIYSLVAGIDPRRTLSVILDVGTNSEKLLKDDLYLGWRHERVRGKEYHDFVDRFIKAARKEMGPGTLIHCVSSMPAPPAELILCRKTLA